MLLFLKSTEDVPAKVMTSRLATVHTRLVNPSMEIGPTGPDGPRATRDVAKATSPEPEHGTS